MSPVTMFGSCLSAHVTPSSPGPSVTGSHCWHVTPSSPHVCPPGQQTGLPVGSQSGSVQSRHSSHVSLSKLQTPSQQSVSSVHGFLSTQGGQSLHSSLMQHANIAKHSSADVAPQRSSPPSLPFQGSRHFLSFVWHSVTQSGRGHTSPPFVRPKASSSSSPMMVRGAVRGEVVVVREELVAALRPVKLRAEWVSADWIAMRRGQRGRIEVGAPRGRRRK